MTTEGEARIEELLLGLVNRFYLEVFLFAFEGLGLAHQEAEALVKQVFDGARARLETGEQEPDILWLWREAYQKATAEVSKLPGAGN